MKSGRNPSRAAPKIQGPLFVFEKARKKWNKRYYVSFDNKTLVGFANASMNVRIPRSTIPIFPALKTPYNVFISEDNDGEGVFAFQINYSPEQILILGAPSVNGRTAWIDNIQKMVRAGATPNALMQLRDKLLSEDDGEEEVEENDVEKIVEQTKKMKLDELDLANLQLSGDLQHIKGEPISKHLRRISIIDLSGNKFIRLPPDILNFSQLEELSIASCKLQAFPAQLQKLPNLTDLDLHDNKIQSIPKEIGFMKNLEKLKTHNNRIRTIDEAFGQLNKLEQFTISGNPSLFCLPKSIGCCVSLQWLDISDCGLTVVPESLSHLPNLAIWNSANNNLRSLPREIGRLTSLMKLNLSNNKLTDLNPNLSLCPNIWKLGRLNILNNPFQDTKIMGILQRGGPSTLKKYLEKQINERGGPPVYSPISKPLYQQTGGNSTPKPRPSHTPIVRKLSLRKHKQNIIPALSGNNYATGHNPSNPRTRSVANERSSGYNTASQPVTQSSNFDLLDSLLQDKEVKEKEVQFEKQREEERLRKLSVKRKEEEADLQKMIEEDKQFQLARKAEAEKRKQALRKAKEETRRQRDEIKRKKAEQEGWLSEVRGQQDENRRILQEKKDKLEAEKEAEERAREARLQQVLKEKEETRRMLMDNIEREKREKRERNSPNNPGRTITDTRRKKKGGGLFKFGKNFNEIPQHSPPSGGLNFKTKLKELPSKLPSVSPIRSSSPIRPSTAPRPKKKVPTASNSPVRSSSPGPSSSNISSTDDIGSSVHVVKEDNENKPEITPGTPSRSRRLPVTAPPSKMISNVELVKSNIGAEEVKVDEGTEQKDSPPEEENSADRFDPPPPVDNPPPVAENGICEPQESNIDLELRKGVAVESSPEFSPEKQLSPEDNDTKPDDMPNVPQVESETNEHSPVKSHSPVKPQSTSPQRSPMSPSSVKKSPSSSSSIPPATSSLTPSSHLSSTTMPSRTLPTIPGSSSPSQSPKIIKKNITRGFGGFRTGGTRVVVGQQFPSSLGRLSARRHQPHSVSDRVKCWEQPDPVSRTAAKDNSSLLKRRRSRSVGASSNVAYNSQGMGGKASVIQNQAVSSCLPDEVEITEKSTPSSTENPSILTESKEHEKTIHENDKEAHNSEIQIVEDKQKEENTHLSSEIVLGNSKTLSPSKKIETGVDEKPNAMSNPSQSVSEQDTVSTVEQVCSTDVTKEQAKGIREERCSTEKDNDISNPLTQDPIISSPSSKSGDNNDAAMKKVPKTDEVAEVTASSGVASIEQTKKVVSSESINVSKEEKSNIEDNSSITLENLQIGEQTRLISEWGVYMCQQCVDLLIKAREKVDGCVVPAELGKQVKRMQDIKMKTKDIHEFVMLRTSKPPKYEDKFDRARALISAGLLDCLDAIKELKHWFKMKNPSLSQLFKAMHYIEEIRKVCEQ